MRLRLVGAFALLVSAATAGAGTGYGQITLVNQTRKQVTAYLFP